MAKFKAIKHKATQDQDGEVKLQLLISQTEAGEVMNIPVGVVLDIEITPEENG
jgi:hypothetical protein